MKTTCIDKKLFCVTDEHTDEIKVTDGYKVVFIHKHELTIAVFILYPHVRIHLL